MNVDSRSRRAGRPPAAELPYFGFNEGWGTAWQGQALDDAIAAAAQAGANTNRLQVRWFDVVGTAGAWDEEAWSRYRTAYQAMLASGINPVVLLVAAPRGTDQVGDPNWAAPECPGGAASPPVPEYDQLWKDFVARAALEFPDALAVQIWNEPNSEEYWGGCDVDPARYVQLVELARQALGPPAAMPIVSAGLADTDGVEAGIVQQLVEHGFPNVDPSGASYWSTFGVTKTATAESAFLE